MSASEGKVEVIAAMLGFVSAPNYWKVMLAHSLSKRAEEAIVRGEVDSGVR